MRHIQIHFHPGGKLFSLTLHGLLQKLLATLGFFTLCGTSLLSNEDEMTSGSYLIVGTDTMPIFGI